MLVNGKLALNGLARLVGVQIVRADTLDRLTHISADPPVSNPQVVDTSRRATSSAISPLQLGYNDNFSEKHFPKVDELERAYLGYMRAYEDLSTEVATLKDERERLLTTIQKLRGAKISLPRALRSRQLCFLHIGKTAGTSVHNMLLEALADAEVFHASLSDFDATSSDVLQPFDLILGHFTYQHVQKLRPDRFLLTFLRDPIERVLSSYYFLRFWSGPVDSVSAEALRSAKELSLRDFLLCENPAVRMYTSDHQTKVIAHDYRQDHLIEGPDIFSLATEHLSTFDFVGIFEYFDEGMRALSQKLGLESVPTVRKLNVTQERLALAPPAAGDVEIILNLNQMDMRIYKAARSEFERLYL